MTTVTLELPDTLAQQLRQKQIGEKEIREVAVAALEFWVANADRFPAVVQSGRRFTESGASFARRLVQQNRALFETLAQR